jgi:hypothetical protein
MALMAVNLEAELAEGQHLTSPAGADHQDPLAALEVRPDRPGFPARQAASVVRLGVILPPAVVAVLVEHVQALSVEDP